MVVVANNATVQGWWLWPLPEVGATPRIPREGMDPNGALRLVVTWLDSPQVVNPTES